MRAPLQRIEEVDRSLESVRRCFKQAQDKFGNYSAMQQEKCKGDTMAIIYAGKHEGLMGGAYHEAEVALSKRGYGSQTVHNWACVLEATKNAPEGAAKFATIAVKCERGIKAAEMEWINMAEAQSNALVNWLELIGDGSIAKLVQTPDLEERLRSLTEDYDGAGTAGGLYAVLASFEVWEQLSANTDLKRRSSVAPRYFLLSDLIAALFDGQHLRHPEEA